MACIDDDEPPPPELNLAWQCEHWKALPDAGGLFDQDQRLMRRMTGTLNIYRAIEHLRNAQGEQIHSLSESERKILGSLVKMGLLFNG